MAKPKHPIFNITKTSIVPKLNPWFFIPFILLQIFAAFLLYNYSQKDLFKWVNTRYTENGNLIMPFVTMIAEVFAIILLPLFALLFKRYRNAKFWWSYVALNVSVALVSQSLKHVFQQKRPFNLYGAEEWFHLEPSWDKLYWLSFPSGHTITAFSNFCFFAMLLPKHLRMYGFIFFCIAFCVAYSRMYLGAHFFADVHAGSLIGVAFSILIVRLFYKPELNDNLFLHK